MMIGKSILFAVVLVVLHVGAEVASCCTTWNAECYTTASAENFNHACKDCTAAAEHCDGVCSSSGKSGDLAGYHLCEGCCQQYAHEVAWNCPAIEIASCCTTWNAECYTTASAANHNHACISSTFMGAPECAADCADESSTACEDCCVAYPHFIGEDWNCDLVEEATTTTELETTTTELETTTSAPKVGELAALGQSCDAFCAETSRTCNLEATNVMSEEEFNAVYDSSVCPAVIAIMGVNGPAEYPIKGSNGNCYYGPNTLCGASWETSTRFCVCDAATTTTELETTTTELETTTTELETTTSAPTECLMAPKDGCDGFCTSPCTMMYSSIADGCPENQCSPAVMCAECPTPKEQCAGEFESMIQCYPGVSDWEAPQLCGTYTTAASCPASYCVIKNDRNGAFKKCKRVGCKTFTADEAACAFSAECEPKYKKDGSFKKCLLKKNLV